MNGRLAEQSSLTVRERDAMFALLCTHFEGVTRDSFDCDLAAKNWVVLITADHALMGFSTLLVYEAVVNAERLTVVYSGDTIIAPEAWRSAAFPRAWIHSVYRLRERFPNGRLVWLLLTSGFRTYRLLPVFWKEFYPRAERSTPATCLALRDELTRGLFGSRFDAANGIVRLEYPQKLKGSLQEIPPGRIDNPDVAFFLAHNPGHDAGDELVCIADLDPSNLSDAGRRVVYGARR